MRGTSRDFFAASLPLRDTDQKTLRPPTPPFPLRPQAASRTALLDPTDGSRKIAPPPRLTPMEPARCSGLHATRNGRPTNCTVEPGSVLLAPITDPGLKH